MTLTGDEDELVERMSIGDFARATGLTPKALRLCDEMELLRPATVDEYSGYPGNYAVVVVDLPVGTGP